MFIILLLTFQDFRSAANKLKAVLNRTEKDTEDSDYRPTTSVPPPPLPPPFQFPYYQPLPINSKSEMPQNAGK